MMISKLGGRKMILTVLCLVAAVVIDLKTTRGLSSNLLTLMIAVIGIYNTSNVLTKVTSKKTSAPSTNDTSKHILDINERQAQYEQYLSGVMTQLENVQKQVNGVNKRLGIILTNKDS